MTAVRQRYLSEGEEIFVEYIFHKSGLIVEMKEISKEGFLEGNNLVVPKVEVTEECFERIKTKLRSL